MLNRSLLFLSAVALGACGSSPGEGRLTCYKESAGQPYQAVLAARREGGWVLSADNGSGRRLTFQVKSRELTGKYETGGLSENWLGLEIDTLGSTQLWFSADAPAGQIDLQQTHGQVEGSFDLYLEPVAETGSAPRHLAGQFEVAVP